MRWILPLAILSVVSAILSRWLPGLLLSEGRIRELLEEEPDPETLARNPQTGVVDSDRLNRIRMLSAQEQRLLPVVSASFAPFIVQLAFCEAIALFGFVLGEFSQSFVVVLPFAAAALGLLLTVSPKLDSTLEATGRLTIHNPAQRQL